MSEQRAEFPLWLELCGLPQYVYEKVRKDAWIIFKKVVELDCFANIDPGIIEISLNELANRTGLPGETVGKCLLALKKKKLISCFIPDNAEEKALIRVALPLPTPIAPKDLKKQRTDIFPPGKDFFRYADQRTPIPQDDATLSEIVDLYYNSIGLKMNFFILDELRLMRQRFELSDIKKTFETARQIGGKNLNWVMRQLLAGSKKDDKKERTRKKKGVREMRGKAIHIQP